MPWVDKEKCTGCEACVDECLVGTIMIVEGLAEINMENCIHCGLCHEVCPVEAIRHDSEKAQDRIQFNIEKTKNNMSDCIKYLKDEKEGQKCLNRMIKHFKNELMIAQKTLEEIEMLSKNKA